MKIMFHSFLICQNVFGDILFLKNILSMNDHAVKIIKISLWIYLNFYCLLVIHRCNIINFLKCNDISFFVCKAPSDLIVCLRVLLYLLSIFRETSNAYKFQPRCTFLASFLNIIFFCHPFINRRPWWCLWK